MAGTGRSVYLGRMPTPTVYVLTWEDDHEPGDTMGVFTTAEAAIERGVEIMKARNVRPDHCAVVGFVLDDIVELDDTRRGIVALISPEPYGGTGGPQVHRYDERPSSVKS